jgi:hypothetical protein
MEALRQELDGLKQENAMYKVQLSVYQAVKGDSRISSHADIARDNERLKGEFRTVTGINADLSIRLQQKEQELLQKTRQFDDSQESLIKLQRQLTSITEKHATGFDATMKQKNAEIAQLKTQLTQKSFECEQQIKQLTQQNIQLQASIEQYGKGIQAMDANIAEMAQLRMMNGQLAQEKNAFQQQNQTLISEKNAVEQGARQQQEQFRQQQEQQEAMFRQQLEECKKSLADSLRVNSQLRMENKRVMVEPSTQIARGNVSPSKKRSVDIIFKAFTNDISVSIMDDIKSPQIDMQTVLQNFQGRKGNNSQQLHYFNQFIQQLQQNENFKEQILDEDKKREFLTYQPGP